MNNDILIYAKYDTNKSIVQIVSSVFCEETKNLVQIDKWQEGQDRYMFAHADNGEYVLSKHGKPLYDDLGRPNYHDGFIEWTEAEKDELYPITPPPLSQIEKQEEYNLDIEYRLSKLELGI